MPTVERKKSSGAKAAQIELNVHPASAVPPEEDMAPIFYRGAQYWLPESIVRAPLTPKVMRQLEKAAIYAVNGEREKMLAEFGKTLVSTSDVPTLIKVVAAAHSEGLQTEAQGALRKALQLTERHDPDFLPRLRRLATQFGCTTS